jgi:hypothetical protein
VDDSLEPSRSHTKTELLAAARAKGFAPSERLVTDWVSLGLLDQPRKRGLGRRKGTIATWPEEQLQLFLVLLRNRVDVKRIATLCNIPVTAWLWEGDRYVPTRQARRALETWAHAREHTNSWRAALETATQLVDQFNHPDATHAARKTLIDLIAQSAYGKPFDGVAILDAFRKVFDPLGVGRTLGPAGAAFVPEHYVFLTQARLAAVTALRQQTLDDAAYNWARQEYLTSRHEYQQEIVPRIAADPEAALVFFSGTSGGMLIPDTTFDRIVNGACVDLLTMLGIYLNYRQPPEHT